MTSNHCARIAQGWCKDGARITPGRSNRQGWIQPVGPSHADRTQRMAAIAASIRSKDAVDLQLHWPPPIRRAAPIG